MTDRLTFHVWPASPDDAGENLHHPRSLYVETYWLGVIGPSATWVLRRSAALLEASGGERVDLDRDDFAQQLGLAPGDGKNNPFRRTLRRLEEFGLAYGAASAGGEDWMVRMGLRQLTRRQVQRLAPSLQESHAKLDAFLEAVAS